MVRLLYLNNPDYRQLQVDVFFLRTYLINGADLSVLLDEILLSASGRTHNWKALDSASVERIVNQTKI